MSTPPLDVPQLRRHDTSVSPLVPRKSRSHKLRLHSSKEFAHILQHQPSYDQHYCRKHLKKGVRTLKKYYEHEIKYLERYKELEGRKADLSGILAILDSVGQSLKKHQPFETSVHASMLHRVSQAEPHTDFIELFTLQTRLLHIDPEESAQLSRLRCKIELHQQNQLLRKTEKHMLDFLLHKAVTIHDLYLLIHSFQIGQNLKNDLLVFLEKPVHRDLPPLSMPSPAIDKKPFYESVRPFEAFDKDHRVGRIKINGHKYDCSGGSLEETLTAFIRTLQENGWATSNAETEAKALVAMEETPVLKLMRATTFNAIWESIEHLRCHLNKPLEEKLSVRKVIIAALPSIVILNTDHFAVIHRQTFQAHPLTAAEFDNPALIFDAYVVITYHDKTWAETLHIKNVQVLDSKYNDFIANCLREFMKARP